MLKTPDFGLCIEAIISYIGEPTLPLLKREW